ncbi:hypothetical protein SAMN00808754_1982 [Thermanaeromonas toyohensis ToBE]|uniref:Uncharacterized protein n=1 Tax=Thermanaeromonas toyohensis ToBE TaxID=698762 RepID=A0A1W1VX70_9FIRM|nr:hypothetical protein [Thermanaeromonas toyohensis]SMB97840.1 hypothetical protein SAMN00808754_1982 [Thermanaeromonas toyohensis ToBE]
MAEIRYISRLEDDGTILLPSQVLERLKWEPENYFHGIFVQKVEQKWR